MMNYLFNTTSSKCNNDDDYENEEEIGDNDNNSEADNDDAEDIMNNYDFVQSNVTNDSYILPTSKISRNIKVISQQFNKAKTKRPRKQRIGKTTGTVVLQY